MATNKTQPTNVPIPDYLNTLSPVQREDAQGLIALMSAITSAPPVLWGTSIVGFGQYRYRYASGREGDWFYCGFAMRKRAISLYLSCDLAALNFDWETLGKHDRSKGCVYIKKLSDVHLNPLKSLVEIAVNSTTSEH